MSSPLDRFFKVCADDAKTIRLLKTDKSIAECQECFFSAAEDSSGKVLREFIRQGADVNQAEPEPFCTTALSTAVASYNLENVKVLLKAGADPNTRGLLWPLVDDGMNDAPPERLKILKELISAGVDLTADMGEIAGQNIYALAEDAEDQKVIKILDAHGIDQPNVVAATTVPPLNLETLQRRLVTALKSEWTKVKRNRKGESFYIFGLETDSDCSTVIPFCNTDEAATAEMADELEVNPQAKYFIQGNHELHGARTEKIEQLQQEINKRDPKLRVKTKLMNIFEAALAELDQKKFFGTGKNRAKIVLAIEIYDADEKEQKLINKIVRRLNPKMAYQPYFGAA